MPDVGERAGQAARDDEDRVDPHVVARPDDAGGEKVACLVVPAYGDEPRDETRRKVEAHFRDVSTKLPIYKRVKVLHLRDAELPRTATRKVKRKQVVEEIQRLERSRGGSILRPA